jgi:NNP family nitrate/nitrite transporter-like MFS transporter
LPWRFISPRLLTEVFKLTPQDAGFRTAGFVVLATALRPVGGVLADKIGGRTILKWVFPVTATMAIFLACPLMSTLTMAPWEWPQPSGWATGRCSNLFRNTSPKQLAE